MSIQERYLLSVCDAPSGINQPNCKEIIMADKTQKVPENVPGKWYVDDTCTPCHTCMEEAANLLKYNEDESRVYFFKQPTTPDEEDAAERAMDVCPTGAIGKDGE